MRDLPIILDMRDRAAVVVGGGVVAARRAELLICAGARVTVFAPEISDEFFELRGEANFRHAPRDPEAEDLVGVSLCFLATEDEGLIERTRRNAKPAGALVNVADRPRLSDFIMPSIVDRSPLVIAVSTGRLADPRADAEGAARGDDPLGLWAPGRADERLSRSGRGGDPDSDFAPPLLGGRSRRTDRRGGARRKRGRG